MGNRDGGAWKKDGKEGSDPFTRSTPAILTDIAMQSLLNHTAESIIAKRVPVVHAFHILLIACSSRPVLNNPLYACRLASSL